LTALNFTEEHPVNGISADWRKADYVIELDRGVPNFIGPKPHANTPSQGIFRVVRQEDPDTVWLTEQPTPKIERIVGVRKYSDVDPEYRKFFTKGSLAPEGLYHQEYREVRAVFEVDRKEVASFDAPDLKMRLRMPERAEVLIHESKGLDKFEFIYRAKYRA
jgi:hypothetical protein